MDLTTDPWVPIIRHDGRKESVSLITIFQEGEQIRDLAVNPPQRIALMRLLICITQAALDGPEDEEDWSKSKDLIPGAVSAYLEQWKSVFNLFGERPFLQATEIKPINNATLDKLDFSLSAGNNSTLFDHHANPLGRPHSSAWIAIMLVTFQCFSPGGLIGTTHWGAGTTTKTSEHAPAIEGSLLHTFLRGEDFLTTVWMNLLTRVMIDQLPGMVFGIPVWENRGVAEGDSDESASSVSSYLGRLVPLSRAIALYPGSQTLTLANGLAYPKLPEQREPNATVVRRGKGNKERDMYISVNLSRHPWRELSSVLSLKRSSVAGGAVCLKHLNYIETGRLDIWTGGMAADKGKILDVAEWIFSLPVEMLEDSILAAYEKGVQLAQGGEFRLKDAVKAWHIAMSVDPKQISYEAAQVYYWSELDRCYDVLLSSTSEFLPLNDQWVPAVRRAMYGAFAHACPHTTPRQIQAFANARQKLRLKKPQD